MKRAPYLNPDAFCRFIGPKNLEKVLVDDELVTCLVDNGAQLNFITPTYAQERGMDIMSLDYLAEEIGGAIPHISGIGGISVQPIGFIMMNVKVPGITGYNEDQITIVMDDPGMMEWLVILGTPTIYRVMEVIKESEMYSVDFAIDCINRTYPGCTGMYLGMVGHMLAFYGKKTNPRAGLLLNQAITASKAIANIPTWMGYFAMWRVKCISTSEASEILAGCKRIEKESLRRACLELQQWFSALQVDSTLSATAQPFQPWVTPQSSREDDVPRSSPVQRGLAGSSPALGFVPDSPLRRAFPSHLQSSDDDRVSTDTYISDKTPCRRRGSQRSYSSWSGSDSDGTCSSGRRCKKKDGFLSKIQIPKF